MIKSGRLPPLRQAQGRAGSPLGYPPVGLASCAAKGTPSAVQTNVFSFAFSRYPPSPLARKQNTKNFKKIFFSAFSNTNFLNNLKIAVGGRLWPLEVSEKQGNLYPAFAFHSTGACAWGLTDAEACNTAAHPPARRLPCRSGIAKAGSLLAKAGTRRMLSLATFYLESDFK